MSRLRMFAASTALVVMLIMPFGSRAAITTTIPSFATPQSASSLQAQIQAILALISQLQAQLAAQQSGGDVVSTPVTTTPPISTLAATCKGTAYQQNTLGAMWSVFPTGGSGSYTYHWTMGQDATPGGEGGINTDGVLATYRTSGTKNAVVVVNDGKTSVTATCQVPVGSSVISTAGVEYNKVSVTAAASTVGSSGKQQGTYTFILDVSAGNQDIFIPNSNKAYTLSVQSNGTTIGDANVLYGLGGGNSIYSNADVNSSNSYYVIRAGTTRRVTVTATAGGNDTQIGVTLVTLTYAASDNANATLNSISVSYPSNSLYLSSGQSTTHKQAKVTSATASPTQITPGQTATISWAATDANNCQLRTKDQNYLLKDNIGNSGSTTVRPTTTTTYTISCSYTSSAPIDQGGYVSFDSKDVTVTVTGASVAPAVVASNTATISAVASTENASGKQVGRYTFTFNVSAAGQDVYIPRGAAYQLDIKSSSQGNVGALNSMTSTADVTSSNNYVIHAGQTKSMTVTATVEGANSYVSLGLSKLYYGTSDALPNNSSIPLNFVSNSIYLSSGQTTTTLATPVINLNASDTAVKAGQNSTLTWSSINATKCLLTSANTQVSAGLSGSVSVNPTSTSDYTLQCWNDPSNGHAPTSANKTITITVSNPVTTVTAPRCSISVDTPSTTLGSAIVVSWNSQNATSVQWVKDTSGKDNLTPPSWTPGTSGTALITANVLGTPSLTLRVTGSGGTATTCTQAIEVSNASVVTLSTPVISLYSSTATVPAGQSASMKWSVANAQRCVLTYGNTQENVSMTGSKIVTPTSTTTYTLWCANDSGNGKDGPSASQSVTIVVGPSVSNDYGTARFTDPVVSPVYSLPTINRKVISPDTDTLSTQEAAALAGIQAAINVLRARLGL